MSISKKSLSKNVLPFLPLLVIYVIIILVSSSNDLIADEGRYITYAKNLTQGFFADADNPSLRNGPGYPLVLLPFVLLNLPFLLIKLLNSIFLTLAVIFFHKTLVNYLQPKTSLIFAYLLGLYPPMIKLMTYIHSESFAIFLVCGFLYYFIKLNTENSKQSFNLLVSATFLGVLALTKVIFGYVILAALFTIVVVYLFKRAIKTKNTLFVLIISFAFCIPYLFYTYGITGKLFYWGTQSGEILYWRSSPFPQEYGDWISGDVVLGNREGDYFENTSVIYNHSSFFKSLEPLSHIERDMKLKEKAVENIKAYPTKFLHNTAASFTRLFFNYPYSYTPQKLSTLFYMIPNMFLLVFLVLSMYLSIGNRKNILFEIRFLGLISMIFIGGLTLSDGRVRHLLPIVPLLLFFIAFALRQFIKYQNCNELNKDKAPILLTDRTQHN